MKPIAQPPAVPTAPELDTSPHVQARILAEALPHLIRYDDQTVVIKFGGHAMGDSALAEAFAQDIVALGVADQVIQLGAIGRAEVVKVRREFHKEEERMLLE